MPPAIGALIAALVVLGFVFLLALLPKKAAAAPASVLSPWPDAGPGEGKYPYADIINKWAGFYKLDPDLVAAHGKVESHFNPTAINLENPAISYDSSYGLMQVQLAVAQDFGAVKDYRHATAAEIAWLMVPEHNVRVGAWNIARWQSRYPWEVAVQMYNVGENGYNNKGYRNADYLRKVREAYNAYNAS